MDAVASSAVPPIVTDHEGKHEVAADAQPPARETRSSHCASEPTEAKDQPETENHGQEGIPIDVERSSAVAPDDDFPEGGLEAWLVLAGSFLALFVSFGFMVAIGTIQEFLQQHQLSHYTSRDIGWIPSVFVYLALGLGIWVGPLFDRYGPRWLALIGSVAYTAMMFLLAECKTYWQFLLCLGFLGGIAGATLTTTSMAVVSHWFKRRRGLAVGIAMCGSSFGGIAYPLVLRSSFPKYGYAWSMRILAFMIMGCLILSNILMKPRLPPSPAAKKAKIISLELFGDLKFTFFTITVFGFEIVLFGALGILPTYANYSGKYPVDTGFYIIAVMNGVSCIGRIIPGYVSDIIGRFNTLLIMIVFTLILMLALWLPFGETSLAALYAFCALFGFGTGSWMALTPACIGQLCEAEQFGRYYGTMYFIASLATLVCVPISGELVETVGPQVMVGFMCAVLGLVLVTFSLSRWACLGWKWKWNAKV
ncbi:MFS transporter, MCP family, solute carrier family 16, member 10 [Exophiala viscosa]|uniref:MFS transporter, MCP family, solute carrier family 16, member 10 n=1 Tax=Exophiala viscosa TaxID=2486360 RepID=A0AAN6E4U2_9EURO|nr:MFS transporter, MCP family, solute carrier family 16, member 10 [Exophiala viscosa]KAI1629549.1 MFS transporter, MCP family, solute carrier family 16, member 10 [Exophiala viscosa]